ncbi:flavin reductase family protein [Sphingobium estronivorans]|uniref:flavin reductase family protein n=1 Tax=Sphingobium estronivorans TaxID=1577690 RepID=UPI0012394AC6|nr:flavin reductase family protein [Sphingobium estronivorans]
MVANEATIDAAHFRHALGHYPTGVCIITARSAEGELFGMAVGSFTSVSLSPALVGFFPDNGSTSWPRIRACGSFCVNVIGSHQLGLCRQFAARGGNKFEGVTHRLSPAGHPILDDCVMWIDCALHDEVATGDHRLVLGRVAALEVERADHPLLFLRGAYGAFQPLS